MSLLSKLFGARTKTAAEPQHKPEDYKGFTITPTPIREGSRYRISAQVEKEGRVHTLIRADTLEDEASAVTSSLAKAKQAIDQLGDGIFG